MKRTKTLLLIFVILLLSTKCKNPTERVNKVFEIPKEYPLIQTCIDNAIDGDTIILSEGIYNQRNNINGKRIIIASNYIYNKDTDIINKTVIGDIPYELGGSYGQLITINDCYDTLEIYGIKILNAKDYTYYSGVNGGGLVINNSIVKLNNLVIEHCIDATGQSKGGGIYPSSSVIFMKDTKVENCVAGTGGGIFAESCNLFIKNCSFINNYSFEDTCTGINFQNCITEMDNCFFRNSNTLGHIDDLFDGSGSIINTIFEDDSVKIDSRILQQNNQFIKN